MPCGEGAGGAQKPLEFLGPPLLFMAQPFPGPAPCHLFCWKTRSMFRVQQWAGAYLSKKARTLKTSKKQKQEKKGNNVFNWPGTFDGERAALNPE
jgi:hypothetical protein